MMPTCAGSVEAFGDVVHTLLLLQLHVAVHLHVGEAGDGPGVTVGENGGVSEIAVGGGAGPQQLRSLHLHATRRPLIVLVALGLVRQIPVLEGCSVPSAVSGASISTPLAVQGHHLEVEHQASDHLNHAADPILRLVTTRHPRSVVADGQVDGVIMSN